MKRFSSIATLMAGVSTAVFLMGGCDSLRALVGEAESRFSDESEQESTDATFDRYEENEARRRSARALPVVELNLEPGDEVIAPRPHMNARQIGDRTMERSVYDLQTVVEVGDDGVLLAHPLSGEHLVHSALVLPVSDNPDIQRGDRILVPSAGKLAVGVVESTNRRDDVAVVRSHRLKMRYNLIPRQFILVDPESTAGHFAFCDEFGSDETFLLFREVDESYLGISQQGDTLVIPKSSCRLLPLSPEVREGDIIRSEMLGTVREATVLEVRDHENAITVGFEWRGDTRNVDVIYGLFEVVDEEAEQDSASQEETSLVGEGETIAEERADTSPNEQAQGSDSAD